MSGTALKSTPTYLRAARLEAGYANRGIAAAAVPYSPEVIGRHERGEVEVDPHAAVIYAEHYNRPDILFHYCSDCPVGRATGRQATERNFVHAVLRLTRRLRQAPGEITDMLEAIADDGIIDETERPLFDTAIDFLRELNDSMTDIFLCTSSNNDKRAAPVAPGSDSMRK